MKKNIQLFSIIYCLFTFAIACKKDELTPTPVAPTPTATKSTAKDITKFSLGSLNSELIAAVDASTGNVTVNIPASFSTNQLVPTFTISEKATVSPASGTAQDFSKEMTYTVTAEDGSKKVFKVNLKKFDILYVGSDDKKIYGLDADTGMKISEFVVGGSVESSPVYANGLLFVGSTDKKFYAFDCITGEKKWEYVSNKPFMNDPSYSNNTIFVNNDGLLIALDANSGAKKWTFSKAVNTNPVIDKGVIFITNGENEQLFAINEKDGSEKWMTTNVGQFVASNGSNTSISVQNDILYVPVNKGVRAINALNGTALWVNWMPYPINSPTVINGLPFTTDEREDLYVTKIGGGYEYIVSTKAPKGSAPVASSSLVFSSLNNAHDIKTGAKKWTNSYEKTDLYPSLTYANDKLYGGIKNKLYALNATTGKESWNFTITGSILSSPSIISAEGKSFYGGESGMEQ